MKRIKLGLLAVALFGAAAAFATSIDNDTDYRRFSATDPIIPKEDCGMASEELCANEYDGQVFVGEVRAVYLGN